MEFGNISKQAVLQEVAPIPRHQRTEPGLCIEKSWQGIHYLLTGVGEGGRAPLSWAVFGDKEIPDPQRLLGYGPARFLTPKQVTSVSKAILRLTEDKFRLRFKRKKMVAAKLYGVRDGEDLEYLWANFQRLSAYYSHAVEKRNGMLIYFD